MPGYKFAGAVSVSVSAESALGHTLVSAVCPCAADMANFWFQSRVDHDFSDDAKGCSAAYSLHRYRIPTAECRLAKAGDGSAGRH